MQNAESMWRLTTAGVPQGSNGPLLFLIYIDDLCDGIESAIYLSADDCSLFQKNTQKLSQVAYISTLHRDLKKYRNWARTGFLFLIHKKV